MYTIDDEAPQIYEGGTLMIDRELQLAFEPLDHSMSSVNNSTKSSEDIGHLPKFTMAQVNWFVESFIL